MENNKKFKIRWKAKVSNRYKKVGEWAESIVPEKNLERITGDLEKGEYEFVVFSIETKIIEKVIKKHHPPKKTVIVAPNDTIKLVQAK